MPFFSSRGNQRLQFVLSKLFSCKLLRRATGIQSLELRRPSFRAKRSIANRTLLYQKKMKSWSMRRRASKLWRIHDTRTGDFKTATLIEQSSIRRSCYSFDAVLVLADL
jgi:hypothetical protein